ncbi:PRC-barrel domain-containing protein [Halobellus sp. H-GB7]|uniref:PRC-barrel domain-containing protein n=1 Tax=Halobellus sp. H-GB7 TaxID=3069756 RepID=UPI0027B0DC39|nr:PRC-barrel domain-containing protein [Halobellus sp. H-GB7]MDQ2055561.1 PRC-barrel domain-containing protein [Halobellus sp. H-GB7]
MDSALASSVAGCSVMTTDGVELGTVENITVNVKTGNLEHLRLDPDGQQTRGFKRNDEGQLLIPADRIEAKHDYLLIAPPRSE